MTRIKYVFTGFIRTVGVGEYQRVMAKADCYLCGGKGRFIHHRGIKRKIVNRNCKCVVFMANMPIRFIEVERPTPIVGIVNAASGVS